MRYTGKSVHLPVGLAANREGMAITFSGPLDRGSATDPGNYAVKTWSLKRSAEYGSEHYDEKSSQVVSADLLNDRCTVFLEIPDVEPTWCMEIRYTVRASDGQRIDGMIHNTVHELFHIDEIPNDE